MEDVITYEKQAIKNSVTKTLMPYEKNLKNVNVYNRAVIDDLLENYYDCYSAQKAFFITLNGILRLINDTDSDFIQHPKSTIKRIITNLVKLPVSSVEGFVYKNSFQHLDDNMIMKISQNPQDEGLIHEYYIGLKLNELRQNIPNFMYVYTLFKCGDMVPNGSLCEKKGNTNFLISELINGNTFQNLINANQMSLKDILTGIIQVGLAVQMAYEKLGFVHMDLHGGNVMIRRRKDKAFIKYTLKSGKTIYVLSDFYATIIDYGWSRIHSVGQNRYLKIHDLGSTYPAFLSNDPLPGVDIYKLISHISTFKNFTYSSLLNDILQKTMSAYGMPPYNNGDYRYFYPLNYTPNLTNFVFYDFLVILLNNIPPEHFPQIFLDTIPKGYNIVGETGCEPDIEKLLDKIQHIPDPSETCRTDPWKKLTTSWKDLDNKERYYFDCGKYYFDGMFNVISFPKGMSLYHGSMALAYYNVSYPLGISYFDVKNDWLGKNELNVLRGDSKIFTNKIKDDIIKKNEPIDLGYYGDQGVASAYSSITMKVQGTDKQCGSNCTFAFKLIKDAIFIDLYDPYNIFKLLYSSNKFTLSPISKQTLEKLYKITGINNFTDLREKFKPGELNVPKEQYPLIQQAFHPFRRFLMESVRNTLRTSDYLIPKELLKTIIPDGYAGFCNPKTVYTEGNLIGQYRFAELVFGKTVLDYLERDFSNKLDWQYFDTKRLFGEIGKLIQDFKRYKTYNINFHQGDLYQHSVWTALYIQQQFIKSTEWVHGIYFDKASMCVIAGFLHDIGKAGDLTFMFYDKPIHHEIGFEYIMNSRIYKIDDVQILDIPTLLRDVNQDTELNQILIAFLTLCHWSFGDHIRKLKDDMSNLQDIAKEYIQDIKNKWNSKITTYSFPGKEWQPSLFAMIILISVCDIMATSAYTNPEKFDDLTNKLATNPKLVINDLNEILIEYPYITNVPKVHRGGNKYEDFKIGTKGLELRRAVMKELQ